MATATHWWSAAMAVTATLAAGPAAIAMSAAVAGRGEGTRRRDGARTGRGLGREGAGAKEKPGAGLGAACEPGLKLPLKRRPPQEASVGADMASSRSTARAQRKAFGQRWRSARTA